MPNLHALTFEKSGEELALTAIEQVDSADIKDGDARIFIAREADIDWLAEAVENHLSQTAAPRK